MINWKQSLRHTSTGVDECKAVFNLRRNGISRNCEHCKCFIFRKVSWTLTCFALYPENHASYEFAIVTFIAPTGSRNNLIPISTYLMCVLLIFTLPYLRSKVADCNERDAVMILYILIHIIYHILQKQSNQQSFRTFTLDQIKYLIWQIE